MTLKKEIIIRLSKELSLPFTGIEQDWALEMAKSKRLNAFLNFYKQNNLFIDEKVAIMSLILASYDDFLNESDLDVDDTWYKIKNDIELEKNIFIELINYWSLSNEVEKEREFRITPLIRMIS